MLLSLPHKVLLETPRVDTSLDTDPFDTSIAKRKGIIEEFSTAVEFFVFVFMFIDFNF